MIIVIKKADFETQPFSNLKTTAKRKTIIALIKSFNICQKYFKNMFFNI